MEYDVRRIWCPMLGIFAKNSVNSIPKDLFVRGEISAVSGRVQKSAKQ